MDVDLFGNLNLTLPLTLTLEDQTEVRVSGVEAGTLAPRLTIKLEFDEVIIFISVPLGTSATTHSSLVPLLQQAVSSLRSAQRAVLLSTVHTGAVQPP